MRPGRLRKTPRSLDRSGVLRPFNAYTFFPEAGHDIAQLFFIALAWLLGGFVHGVAAVGGGMVAMPIATTFTGAREAILISCLTGLIIPLALSVLYRRHILLREVLWLSAGCIPGIPAGVALLTVLSGSVLLFGVGTMLIVFVLWQMCSHSVRTTLPFHPAARFSPASSERS